MDIVALMCWKDIIKPYYQTYDSDNMLTEAVLYQRL